MVHERRILHRYHYVIPQSEQHQLGARVSCILEQVGALSLVVVVVVVQEVEVEVQSKSESPSPCPTLCRACATNRTANKRAMPLNRTPRSRSASVLELSAMPVLEKH